MINAGINNIIYMGLISGPKIANGNCGTTTDAGTMDRGSTVFMVYHTNYSMGTEIPSLRIK
jgi:hypothetical protein